ncbi:DUF1516 family protein [Staphylococcus haemolyticus]|uniref:UPF0344 protein AL503_012545 n=3 Tax=Staphylococcus TaxID=1279 RepID=A0A2K0A965_STAHA|nr:MULTISPECIES: YisL family protein [Staphylococcus]MBY6180021.1 YisL family protein [Staphylococcaceae bacterium DP2N0-1]KGF28765.1 hypothetical protein HMPREF2135_01375 [Staphylococcus haemolyticus DNF00585]KGJ25242.1 hypothetical protein ES23_11255 [Staphylococcus haemolyticus]KGJ27355.1 hypothetical protein ES24_06395 [Staphylococcus haemolyticus]MBE7355035.1 YisL family protein [Staphylococcus haemolyticus]
MLHMHIASWALTIILYVIAFLHISKSQGPTPMFKPLQMALRVFMLLTLFSGFWLLIQEFMAASHGGGGNHMLLTLKMLCGIAVVALMEVSIAKRKKHEASHGLFWATIILIIITMALGIILPWGPISSLFGIS